MAAVGLGNFSSGATGNQPHGPIFADDEDCMCALQEALGKDSWRCVANETSNIYSGQTGKWFLAVNQSNPASLQESPNSDSNPPDVDTSYVIKGEGQNAKFQKITSQNRTAELDEITSPNGTAELGDMACSGKNDTEASSALYKYLAVSMTESLEPCWQMGITPLILQNASSWNAMGCNLGFFCMSAILSAPGRLEKYADCFDNHRSEQQLYKLTNLLHASSPGSSR